MLSYSSIILGNLLKKLTSIGVIPYYVFQCRPVTGVKNQFQVPLTRGIDIVEGAKNLQNGQGKCFKYCLSSTRGKIEIVKEKVSKFNCIFTTICRWKSV